MSSTPDYHTLIVGAGFSGIGAAIKLDNAGLSNYLVIEAGDGVGGTWHWNTYPGIAVDIPSFSYQFSFEQSPDWSRTYARGRELKAYAEHCVDKYGIRSRIRLNTKVQTAEFDDERCLWRVQTDPGGTVTARFLISACGVLTVPNLPDIDGVDTFGGVTMHTARWDHAQDLTGKRVAIIGTGASAVQVIPEIAPIVKQLTVFQRTPIWCFPKLDVALPAPARWAMRVPGGKVMQRLLSQAFVEVTFPISAHYFTVVPLAKRMESAGLAYLRKQVHDPTVREQLTPRYAVGCKRPGFHNEYLATFNRDNVRLVTEPIDKITPAAVATTDGESHEVDVLVLATGFKVMDPDEVPTFAVTGSGGKSLEPVLGRAPAAGLRGRQRARFSQPVHGVRPVRLRRLFVFRAHRDADPPHRAVPETGPARGRDARRGHRGSQRPVLRRDDAPTAPADLLAGQLPAGQQLLLRQERRRAAAPRHHGGGVLAQSAVRPRRLSIHQRRRNRRSIHGLAALDAGHPLPKSRA